MNKGHRLKLAVASAESLNVDPERAVVLIPAERPPLWAPHHPYAALLSS
jgi:hypothetical protein